MDGRTDRKQRAKRAHSIDLTVLRMYLIIFPGFIHAIVVDVVVATCYRFVRIAHIRSGRRVTLQWG